MFRFISFLFHTFPLILAWLQLVVAFVIVLAYIVRVKKRIKQAISLCVLTVLNGVYILLFLTTFFFFFEIWEMLFSILGITTIFICACWTRYEDKRNGQIWWEW